MVYVSQRSFEYLVAQKGELAATLSDGKDHWVNAYKVQLQETLEQIEKYCVMPARVLDIGSGLGGIDVKLIEACGSHCTLIDGENGGSMAQHCVPFGSRSSVDAFMADNGIAESDYAYCNPDDLPQATFDLVISLRSWCFHYGPELYLDYVMESLRKGGKVIVDMRRGKHNWRLQMRAAMNEIAVVQRAQKFNRLVFQKE
jgi:SAM-dependent methyltransferase